MRVGFVLRVACWLLTFVLGLAVLVWFCCVGCGLYLGLVVFVVLVLCIVYFVCFAVVCVWRGVLGDVVCVFNSVVVYGHILL